MLHFVIICNLLLSGSAACGTPSRPCTYNTYRSVDFSTF